MTPGVGRSLTEGFRLASRSWGGMGLFVLAWTLIGVVVVAAIAVTRPPASLLEQGTAASGATLVAPAADNTVPADSTAPIDSAVPTAQAPMATDSGTPAPKTPAAEAPQQREQREWLAKAWPMLMLCGLILIVAGLLIQGGQVGYVAQRVRTGHVTLGEVGHYATHAFAGLLGAGALSFAVIVAAALAAAGVLAGLGAVSGVVAALVGVLLALAAILAAIWLSMRVALWPIAIVADHQGPIAGLKTSWRLSRGQWWRLAGIAAVMFVISIAVALLLGLIEWAGNAAGGGAALALQMLSGLTGFVANLFLSFAMMGALVRFHDDVKASGTA